MRWFALVGVLGIVGGVRAETPGTIASARDTSLPAMTKKSQDALDDYLKAWEQRCAKLTGLETKLLLTEVEGGEKAQYTGELFLLKPNMVRLFMKDATDVEYSKSWRHYLADGTHFFDFSYAKKVVRRSEMPKDGLNDITPLAMIWNMQAETIKKQYHLHIDLDDPKKCTAHYLHITIAPKMERDLQAFAKAELVLWISKDPKYAENYMLPARLWYQQVNKNHYAWEFRNLKATDTLKATAFKLNLPAKDWHVEDTTKP